MGLIITRDQYTVQPQGLPRIDKSNRLGGRVRSLVLRGVNLANGKTATWSGTKKFSGRAPDGLLTSLDGSSNLDLTNIGLYNPASTGVTLAFVARNGTPASVGGTLRITPSSGGNTFCAIRGTNTSYRLGAGYATGGTLPMFTGAAVAASGVAERTVITCANGLTSTTSTDYEVWINGTKYTTSGPIAFAAQTAGATYFGWDGADSKFPGTLDELAVFEGALSDAEVAEYFRNPYQMYARPASRVWFGAAAAGGGVTLTIADAAHAHAADAITLASASDLAVADSAHAHTSEVPALSADTSISVQDQAHAHTDGGPLDLSGVPSLAVDAVAHGHTSDAITLSSESLLAIADALHGHTSTSVVLVLPSAAYLLTEPFKDWDGNLLALATIPGVVVLDPATRAVLLSLADQVTQADARLRLEDSALPTGQPVVVVSFNADGSARGVDTYTVQ